jgi:O-succinylbenzoic acid--CoA ligase
MKKIDWKAGEFPDLFEDFSKESPDQIFFEEPDIKHSYSVLHHKIKQHQQYLVKDCSASKIGIHTNNPLSAIVWFWAGLLARKKIFLLNHYLSDTAQKNLCSEFGIQHCVSDLLNFSKDYSNHSQLQTKIPMNDGLIHLFSSGSTGKPRCIVHSLYTVMINAFHASHVLNIDNSSRYLLNLPLFHVSGLSIFCRSLLAKACIIKSIHHPTQIKSQNISHISVVENQLISLLEFYDKVPENLKVVLVGGGPVRDSVRHKIEEKKFPVYYTYGMTETASGIAIGHYSELESGYSGRILDHTALKIKNDECCIQCSSLSLGYINPANHKLYSLTDSEAYFHSGDKAEINQKGQIKIIGRLDNMFISNGENIHPEAIEAVITENSWVNHCFVVQHPHPDLGYVPVAFILPFPTNISVIQDLEKQIKSRLSSLHCPKRWLELPKKQSLKYSRLALKELATKEQL